MDAKEVYMSKPWLKYYPEGVPEYVDIPDISVSELFDQTAADVADSMFTIAQAGFSTSDALALAKLAAEGAAVGFTTAETSAQVLVGVLKAYEMPVSKAREVMDILFQTVDTGIITFEDLSTNLGRVLASASALDVPLTDVTGTVATLTLRGFSAAQAMTSVNRIMMTFLRPSQRAKKAAAELGIELNRDTIAAEGLVPMLNKMWVASGQNANKFAEMFDRIQSTRGALSLMSDDGALLARVMEDMGMATADAGAMAEAMEHRAKSLKFQMSILRVQVLAVATQALEPLSAGIATVVQQFNRILSGKVAFFNFFADLKAMVLAVAAAFMFMKRQAITAMFFAIAGGVRDFVAGLSMAVRVLGPMQTALQGLRLVLTTIGPMLVFLAVFALAKFAGQFDPVAKAVKRTKERLAGLNDELARNQELLDLGVITPEQFGLRAWMNGTDAVVRSIEEDFGPALNKIENNTGSFGDSWVNLGATIRRVVTGDFRRSGTVLQDEFNKTLEETIQGLKDAGTTATGIDKVADHLLRLSRAAKDIAERELFARGAEEVRKIADETREIEEDLIAAAKAGDGLNKTFGQTLTTASDIKKGIEKWIQSISDAKALMEEILGLTNRQEIMYSSLIEPALTRIALRDVRIADLRFEQAELAEGMGKSVDDIEEGENAIFDALENEVGEHERLNEKDRLYIDTMETRLKHEDQIGKEMLAQNTLADLLNGKYDGLTGTVMPEQLRLLTEVVRTFLPEGGEGIKNWITLTEGLGQTLDEDVLDTLMLILEADKDMELAIDVSEALFSIGRAQNAVDVLNTMLSGLDLPAQEFGAGIIGIGPGFRGFQHGIRNFVGGMMRVGEAGEELIRLPRGSDVIPRGNISHELRRQGQQGGGQGMSASAEVNITTSLLKDFQELKAAVLRAVDEKLDEAGARTNLSRPRFGTWGAGMPRT